MNGHGDEEDDLEIELGELENDAFLPHAGKTRSEPAAGSVLVKWMPPRIRGFRVFLQSISKVKLALAVVVVFVLAASVASYMHVAEHIRYSIPEESLALRAELAASLNGTSIPTYVLDYAPYVFLHKSDEYNPSDIQKHIESTYPSINFTAVSNAPKPLTLDNLNELNNAGGEVFLSSVEELIKFPDFLKGQLPDPKTLATTGAKSAVVIVADKGNGIVDAFYMYFYSFNDGPQALNHQVGNHLGDWEHNMVRFQNGTPTAVWYSQHEFGFAFTYAAVRKIGQRPVTFSAKGSHANYAVAGNHDFHDINKLIPAHIVYDRTQMGPLWDPTLGAYYYTFDAGTKKLTAATADTPSGFLEFEGHWGDHELPREAEGQQEFHGYVKWVSGPKGPLTKGLDRVDVCLPTRKCVVRDSL